MGTQRENDWIRLRKAWIKANPPNHEGTYLCGVCAKPVHISQFELDHIKGREGALFSDLDNYQPTHSFCNQLKGSSRWTPKVSKVEYKLRKEMEL